VEQRSNSGGVVAVDGGEVSVARRGLSITSGGLTVGAGVVAHSCFLMSQGDEIAHGGLVVTVSRRTITLCGRKVAPVGGGDRFCHPRFAPRGCGVRRGRVEVGPGGGHAIEAIVHIHVGTYLRETFVTPRAGWLVRA
jgi:hypothetical protein